MIVTIITLVQDESAVEQAQRCYDSIYSLHGKDEVIAFKVKAITPEEVDMWMHDKRIHWTYPWDKPTLDIRSGLNLHPYTTATPAKRVACFLSHYSEWEQCAVKGRPQIIMEQDALLTKRLPFELLEQSKFQIIGLNDPRGATRKSAVFHQKVEEAKQKGYNVIRTPKVDNENVPQGIAGNSAYYITPEGAQKMIDLVKEFGAWPNDAIMCRQLFDKLGVTTTYYSTVQKTASTTTL